MPTNTDAREPLRALVAVALTIVLVSVLSAEVGGWALLLVPIGALWTGNVYLGGRLNDPVWHLFDKVDW